MEPFISLFILTSRKLISLLISFSIVNLIVGWQLLRNSSILSAWFLLLIMTNVSSTYLIHSFRPMSRNLYNLWFYNIFPIIGLSEYSVRTDYRLFRIFGRLFGFYRLSGSRIFGFYLLFKILFFSKYPTDFTDYTNIR